jgi:hypothetical protein
MCQGREGQAGAIEAAPEMIKAGARIIADAFDLEFEGYRAEAIAEEVIRTAFLAAKSRTP